MASLIAATIATLPAPADISPFENNGPVEDAGSSRLGKKQYGIRPHLKITYQLSSNYNAQETLQTCVDILRRRFVKAGIGRHVEISVREDLRRVHPEIIEPWHYSDQAAKGTSTVAERMNTMSTARPAPPAPTTTARVDLFEPETEDDEIETPTEVVDADAHLATPTAGDNERVAEAPADPAEAVGDNGRVAETPADPAEAVGDNGRVANSSTSTTAANEWTNDRIRVRSSESYAAPLPAPKRTHQLQPAHQLQPNGLLDDRVPSSNDRVPSSHDRVPSSHDRVPSSHLERIKELAKLEKEEADREVVKSLERQKKAGDILALLGL